MKVHQGRLEDPRGYLMEFLLTIPDEISDRILHVFLHGLSRIESQSPPVFAKRRWAVTTLTSPCLFLSDPIHRWTPDSACGWYLLGEDFFEPSVIRLRDSVLSDAGLSGTVWHGPSSGGYAAIKYWLRSDKPDLVFTVAPHNDPSVLPQWATEAAPFGSLPGMAQPRTIVDIFRESRRVPGRHLYSLISEHDTYFALDHLQPIAGAVDVSIRTTFVRLRNAMGHGFVSDTDYEHHLAVAIERWTLPEERGMP